MTYHVYLECKVFGNRGWYCGGKVWYYLPFPWPDCLATFQGSGYNQAMNSEISLLGTFGMAEMECAASLFVQESIEREIPLERAIIDVGNHPMSRSERVGMVQLAWRGWISAIYPHSEFMLTHEAVERIRSRHPEYVKSPFVRAGKKEWRPTD